MKNGFFILAVLLQFFVGIVQLISGAFHSIKYKDKLHAIYFGGAVAYLAFLFVVGSCLGNAAYSFFLGFFVFLVPVGIATWYYIMTWKAYQQTDYDGKQADKNRSYQEDVLDDILI